MASVWLCCAPESNPNEFNFLNFLILIKQALIQQLCSFMTQNFRKTFGDRILRSILYNLMEIHLIHFSSKKGEFRNSIFDNFFFFHEWNYFSGNFIKTGVFNWDWKKANILGIDIFIVSSALKWNIVSLYVQMTHAIHITLKS